MATTTFSGPVVSGNGFVGSVNVSSLTFASAPTSASNASNFAANVYITVVAGGTTYYIPAADTVW